MKTIGRGHWRLILAAAMTFSLLIAAPAAAVNIGEDGCTPGFWKNHTDQWEEYSPTDTLGDLFTFPASLSGFADDSLLSALQGGGGNTLADKVKILMRAATAAFLNAAHEGVGYPYRRFTDPFNIQATVNAALATENKGVITALASHLDDVNNLGCPL